MKLVASVRIAEAEQGRYIYAFLYHLLDFCDEVVLVYEDPERSNWGEQYEQPAVKVFSSDLRFFDHEGRARQELLEITLNQAPSHVLAVDADEFVDDGRLVRAACEDDRWDAWALCMQEVWNASADELEVRQDGGWVEHDVACLWRVDRLRKYAGGGLAIADRPLACGRVPTAVQQSRCGHTCTGVMHFGWVKKSDRQARYDRYDQHDGGRFHASAHLQSILMPDEEIALMPREWPESWETELRSAILASAS